MDAFSILALRGFSFVDENSRSTFGNDKLEVLVKYFGTCSEGSPVIDPECTRMEFSNVKSLVISQHYPTGHISTLIVGNNLKVS